MNLKEFLLTLEPNTDYNNHIILKEHIRYLCSQYFCNWKNISIENFDIEKLK